MFIPTIWSDQFKRVRQAATGHVLKVIGELIGFFGALTAFGSSAF